MKKTKHSEEKIIGAVKQLESGRVGQGTGAGTRGHGPDAGQLKIEVRRDGRQ
jgi:hypothetical protein